MAEKTKIQDRIFKVWSGFFKKPARAISRVFVHCSASDNPVHDNAATMHKWHLERGFAEIGYHYFIRKDGTIEEGRDIEKVPAAQSGHNTGTIAICCHGLTANLFTDAQFAALARITRAINNSYSGKLTFHGHCEVAAKLCPVFKYKTVLKLDKFGRLGV